MTDMISDRGTWEWLCHADARQVYDLPDMMNLMSGLRPSFLPVIDRQFIFQELESLTAVPCKSGFGT
jgi:hypothetical protein